MDGRNTDVRPHGGGKINRYHQMKTNNHQNLELNSYPNEHSIGGHFTTGAVDSAMDVGVNTGSGAFRAPTTSIGEGQPSFPTAHGDATHSNSSSAVKQSLPQEQQHLLLKQMRQEEHQKQLQQQLQQVGPSPLEQLVRQEAIRQRLQEQEQTQQHQLRQLKLHQLQDDRLEQEVSLASFAGTSGVPVASGSDLLGNTADSLGKH